MPRVMPGVSDSTGLLAPGDAAKIKRRTGEFERRFSGLTMQVAVHQFGVEHPFSLHAFWMFNGGSFAGNANRGANNRTVFLAIDPARAESSLAVGYALEPILPRDALDHLLEMAGPFWEAGKWADGIHRVLDGLEHLLASVARPRESHLPTEDF